MTSPVSLIGILKNTKVSVGEVRECLKAIASRPDPAVSLFDYEFSIETRKRTLKVKEMFCYYKIWKLVFSIYFQLTGGRLTVMYNSRDGMRIYPEGKLDAREYQAALTVARKIIQAAVKASCERKLAQKAAASAKQKKVRAQIRAACDQQPTQQGAAPAAPVNAPDAQQDGTSPITSPHLSGAVPVEPGREREPGGSGLGGCADAPGSCASGNGCPDAACGAAPSQAEGTGGLNGSESSRAPSAGGADAAEAPVLGAREALRNIRRELAAKGPAGVCDAFGGIFSYVDKPDPVTVRKARQLFARLLPSSTSEGSEGPRWDVKKVSVKTATLRSWTMADRKLDFGQPGIAVASDVSGSMARIADTVLVLAHSVAAANEAVQLVIKQSNGYIDTVWHKRRVIFREDENDINFEACVEKYKSLFRDYDISILVIFADSDGFNIYSELTTIVKVLWIDNYLCSTIPSPRLSNHYSNKVKNPKNFIHVVGCGDEEKFLQGLKLAIKQMRG